MLSHASLGKVNIIIAADSGEIPGIKKQLQINPSFIYLFLGTAAQLLMPLSFWVHLEL